MIYFGFLVKAKGRRPGLSVNVASSERHCSTEGAGLAEAPGLGAATQRFAHAGNEADNFLALTEIRLVSIIEVLLGVGVHP